MRRVSKWGLVLALSLAASRASADDADECASASEHGQSSRNERKWNAAREQFLSCAQARCPAIVRADCEQWLGELARAMPTVIVSAKDPRGSDVVEVRIFVDGVLVAERTDGKAVPLDPGPHELRFERAGYLSVVQNLVANEAEQNRRVDVSFVAVPVGRKRKRMVGYALGAAGVVSLGAFVYLAIDGQLVFGRCRDTPMCSASDVDALGTKRYLALGSLAATLVLGGVGGYLVLTNRERSPVVQASVGVLPGGALAALRAEF